MTKSMKLSAVAFAVMWTAWMAWRDGYFDPTRLAIMAICGAIAGIGWYHVIRGIVLMHPQRPTASRSLKRGWLL